MNSIVVFGMAHLVLIAHLVFKNIILRFFKLLLDTFVENLQVLIDDFEFFILDFGLFRLLPILERLRRFSRGGPCTESRLATAKAEGRPGSTALAASDFKRWTH